MENTVTLTPEAITKLSESVSKFCKLDSDRSFALHQFLQVLGDEPSYENWETARIAAIKGYLTTKPHANVDAQNKFWSRYVQQLKNYVNENDFDFTIPEKPKAETKAAETQRKKRANTYKDMPREKLEETIGELQKTIIATPTPEAADNLKKAVEALHTADAAMRRAKNTAQNADKNKRADAIKTYLKGAGLDVVALFEVLMHATSEISSSDVQERNWRLILGVALERLGLEAQIEDDEAATVEVEDELEAYEPEAALL